MDNEEQKEQTTSVYEDVKQALTDWWNGIGHKDDTTPDENYGGFLQGLNDFYHSYVVETASGSFQVFQSFTYGEMLICILLFCGLLLFTFKWLWEVLR